jgi:CheY-like chemotaxis protein
VVLIAEDDPEDRMLTQDALQESRLSHHFHFVEDGEELMDFLLHRKAYTDTKQYPRPALILLDLNMPRKDGREALKEIKNDPYLCRIPVVVLTTSQAEEDVTGTYGMGVNSFITKPVTYEGLVEIMNTLSKYWFETVELPEA